ncbi:MAG: VOC family protein [Pseudomonadota bacterium]
MSDSKPGQVVWTDLTVNDAGELRDFYRDVVGWRVQDTDMGDYDDYTMLADGSDDGVAGVCHARGSNAGLPPVWLNYVAVADLDASMARCVEKAGAVVHGPAPLAGGRFCVIRDPAGAHLALFQPPAENED